MSENPRSSARKIRMLGRPREAIRSAPAHPIRRTRAAVDAARRSRGFTKLILGPSEYPGNKKPEDRKMLRDPGESAEVSIRRPIMAETPALPKKGSIVKKILIGIVAV